MILRFGNFNILYILYILYISFFTVIQEMQTQAENHLHQMIGLK